MKKKIFFVLGIIWMIIVFYFSSQEGESSGNASGTILNIILKIFPSLEGQADTVHMIIRKLAHFTIYMIGGIIYINLFKAYNIKNTKSLLYSTLVCTIYAITDEVHQYFVPGRACMITDVIIDAFGAVFGCMVYLVILKIYKKLFKAKLF